MDPGAGQGEIGAAHRPLSRRTVVKAGAGYPLGGAAGAAGGRPGATRARRQDEAEGGVLTDVPGFVVGHATLTEPITGCTVILCPPNTTGGVEVRGGWTGTRELDILSPLSASPVVHGLLLTGGSTYGLAAADGVMRWIEEHFSDAPDGLGPVPQVPGAVIYDLTIGDPRVRPGSDEGYQACENARQAFERGSVGAGTGARVGAAIPGFTRMKSGLGSAGRRFGEAGVVGALAVVNALGNVVDRDGRIVAGAYDRQGRHGDPVAAVVARPLAARAPSTSGRPTTNTTLVAVATNAELTKTQCAIVAKMAQAGLARAVHPVFTASDGDVVFVLAGGGEEADVDAVGILAAEVVADAIRDAVRQATSLGGVSDMHAPGVRSPDDPAWSAD